MKVVYFGSDVFLTSFRYVADNCEVLALYTYHNDEDCFSEYEICREASRRGIPVFSGRITESEVRRYFEQEGCELFFVAEYGYIIPVPTGYDDFRAINVHSSRLPDGRGYYPIERAMERGCSETAVTMHKIVAEIDSGDIIYQERMPITPEMDSVDVYIESAALALKMTRNLLSDFGGAWRAARPQIGETSQSKRPVVDRLTLRHSMTTAEAMALRRVYNQMTQVTLPDGECYVVAMEPGRARLPAEEIVIGTDRLLFATADGHLRLSVIPIGGGK